MPFKDTTEDSRESSSQYTTSKKGFITFSGARQKIRVFADIEMNQLPALGKLSMKEKYFSIRWRFLASSRTEYGRFPLPFARKISKFKNRRSNELRFFQVLTVFG